MSTPTAPRAAPTAPTAPTAPPRAGAGTSTARQVADAVLYEGYVLFPYRASAMKNSFRWQWGVVAPQQHVDVSTGEVARMSCDVPLAATPDTRLSVTARFLQLCHRQVADPDGQPVDRWEVGTEVTGHEVTGAEVTGHEVTGAEVTGDADLLLTWDEGHEREVRTPPIPVFRLLDTSFVQTARMDPTASTESHADGSTVTRTVEAVVAEVEMSATEVDDGVVRIHVEVRNATPWCDPDAERDAVLRRSMVGTHLLLSTLGGEFGSVIDPPDWAAAADCHSRGLYPVLAGEDEGDDVVLAAPIILDDHPRVAPESPGPAFDALEIDELMALAVQGLTDQEKREARATDPRAAEVVDAFGSLSQEVMQRLHGTVREFGPDVGLRPEPEAGVDEETVDFFGVGEAPLDEVSLGDRTLRKGDEVVLRPGRRADAHDLFADGRTATVERMVQTVDGDTLVAVTLTEDPAADLHRWYGRFQYFHLDEVELPDPDE